MESLTPSLSDSGTNYGRGSGPSTPESYETQILGKRKRPAPLISSDDDLDVRVGISAKAGSYEEHLHRDGFICLSSDTHQIVRTERHMPDMSSFVGRLKTAYENRRNNNHYQRVSALLLQFEDDDLGVQSEVRELATMFRDTYKFAVDVFRIPSNNDSPENLCIVYYGGHATKEGYEQPTWVSNRQRDVEVESSMILPLFKERDADIWLLFDCCQAMPHAFNTTGKGVVSALTATGFEPGEHGVAAEVGPHSFTHTLVQVLGQLSMPPRPDELPKPFTDITLHARMLTELSKWSPSLQKGKDGSYIRSMHGHHVVEPCRQRTPIYQFLSRNKEPKSIYIRPLQEDRTTSPSYEQLQADNESGDCSSPQVLISVRLGVGHLDDTDIRAWVNYMQLMPGGLGSNAPGVTIEAIYPSLSTLLILRIPLSFWDLLPRDESMDLIGYVTGANYANSFRERVAAAMGSMPEITSTKIDDIQISKSDLLRPEISPSQPTAASQPQHFEQPAHTAAPATPRTADALYPIAYVMSGKKKAQRISQACDSCRSLKAKCDETKPCKNCKEKNIECKYRDPIRKR